MFSTSQLNLLYCWCTLNNATFVPLIKVSLLAKLLVCVLVGLGSLGWFKMLETI